MGIFSEISSILDSPSQRDGVDHAQKVSHQAVTGVFLVFRRLSKSRNIDLWLKKVGEDFLHLHHEFVSYWDNSLTDSNLSPLSVFEEYLQAPQTKSIAFLDFLECAFKNGAAPLDNDIILAINHVLADEGCPYRLSEFVLEGRNNFLASITATRRPFVYLTHDSAVQIHAIAPALALFHNEDLAAPADAFQNSLERHGRGDYQGCITSCTAAVEGAIKVVAERRDWSLRGSGVGSLGKSFIRNAGLPDKLSQVTGLLAERRQNAGDAHGHEQVHDVREAEARFLIGISASFIVLVASELCKKNTPHS